MSSAVHEPTTYLVDGYNYLHRAIGLSGKDLERKRAQLEILMREFRRARPGTTVVIVYDGARFVPPRALTDRGRIPSVGDVEILWSRPPSNADALLLVEAECRRREQNVVVVSSDRKDIGSRLGEGVEWLSSEDFAELVEAVIEGRDEPDDVEEPADPEKPEIVSADETEEWLRLFGGEASE